MGSHHSHESAHHSDHSGTNTPRRGSHSQRSVMPKSESGGELATSEKPPPTSLVPVEKLGKLLAQRSQKEDVVNGITENSFTKYVFPAYPELAKAFYAHIHRAAKSKNQHMQQSAFRQQCERVLAMLDNLEVIETYVRMFSVTEEAGSVSRECLRRLLHTSYKISMDHYPEGPQTCLLIALDHATEDQSRLTVTLHKTLSAVVNGCFKETAAHSVGFVVRWLSEHCHRLIFPVHRYCVHVLSTRHRELSAGGGAADVPDGALSLATPVLERAAPGACGAGGAGGAAGGAGGAGLLSGSAAWLIAGTAPASYSAPLRQSADHTHLGGTLASAAWLARLVCAVPSHWVPLYCSREHGQGANRFLHHTTGYRGPTLVLLAAAGGDPVLVVASPCEWKETHQYWGGPDAALIQLYPAFAILEQAPKMLYLNTSIRGYPRGLRAGSDPRAPLLAVSEDFDTMTLQGVPYDVHAIEVWGCGDTSSRETQLEIKKWQVKEAERQSQVKLSASDWIEHPDRYLLELGGRPQYNNSTK